MFIDVCFQNLEIMEMKMTSRKSRFQTFIFRCFHLYIFIIVQHVYISIVCIMLSQNHHFLTRISFPLFQDSQNHIDFLCYMCRQDSKGESLDETR